eukprot:TRINITY_DN53926_c0_g1_i1.p1 TRINITY_DN53926_c0_g1~~TRINITY_DN53926_c0_g1_i1.p1  ORF type:complete len:330 (-),score=23.99 TRINITY_DN53926_c0_g1_i1:337-1326(-)
MYISAHHNADSSDSDGELYFGPSPSSREVACSAQGHGSAPWETTGSAHQNLSHASASPSGAGEDGDDAHHWQFAWSSSDSYWSNSTMSLHHRLDRPPHVDITQLTGGDYSQHGAWEGHASEAVTYGVWSSEGAYDAQVPGYLSQGGSTGVGSSYGMSSTHASVPTEPEEQGSRRKVALVALAAAQTEESRKLAKRTFGAIGVTIDFIFSSPAVFRRWLQKQDCTADEDPHIIVLSGWAEARPTAKILRDVATDLTHRSANADEWLCVSDFVVLAVQPQDYDTVTDALHEDLEHCYLPLWIAYSEDHLAQIIHRLVARPLMPGRPPVIHS